MCKTLLFRQSYKLVDVNTLQYFEFVKMWDCTMLYAKFINESHVIVTKMQVTIKAQKPCKCY